MAHVISVNKTHQIALQLSREEKWALELKDKGYTVRQMADEMGCAVGTAWNRLYRGIRKLPQEIAHKVREKEVQECDLLMRETLARVMQSDDMRDFFAGIKSMCMLKDRKARYLGLDAPQKTESTILDLNITDDELQQKVADLLKRNMDNSDEDIIDG